VMKSYIRKQLLPILFSYLICEGSGLQTDWFCMVKSEI
jgi:hypothetical protein